MEYKVGEQYHCPKCGNWNAKIVWISEDGKTIGVQCPTSGPEHKSGTVVLVNVEK